jgi:hypothetical protein
MDKKLKSLLKKEQLEHLLPVFADQGITDSILGDLSDGDLRDLGIDKLGERKRLLAAFQEALGDDSSFGTMISVEGGTLLQGAKLVGTNVATFEIGKYAVTMQEWNYVKKWAIDNCFGIAAGQAITPAN